MSRISSADLIAFVAGSLAGESPLCVEDAVAASLRLVDELDEHGWVVVDDPLPLRDDDRIEFAAGAVPTLLVVNGTTYDVVERATQQFGGADMPNEDELERALLETAREQAQSVVDDAGAWPADAVFSREACAQAEQAVDAALLAQRFDEVESASPPVAEPEVDTSNDMLVAIRSSDSSIAIQALGPMAIDRDRALRMAAWIVSLADPLGDDFARVLKAVQST